MNINNVEYNLDHAVCLLKALSNKRRLAIVCALYKGEKSVGALEKIIGLSQSALSQHLARLREDGLVKTRRHAQTIYYSLANERADAILHALCGLFHTENEEADPEQTVTLSSLSSLSSLPSLPSHPTISVISVKKE